MTQKEKDVHFGVLRAQLLDRARNAVSKAARLCWELEDKLMMIGDEESETRKIGEMISSYNHFIIEIETLLKKENSDFNELRERVNHMEFFMENAMCSENYFL